MIRKNIVLYNVRNIVIRRITEHYNVGLDATVGTGIRVLSGE